MRERLRIDEDMGSSKPIGDRIGGAGGDAAELTPPSSPSSGCPRAISCCGASGIGITCPLLTAAAAPAAAAEFDGVRATTARDGLPSRVISRSAATVVLNIDWFVSPASESEAAPPLKRKLFKLPVVIASDWAVMQSSVQGLRRPPPRPQAAPRLPRAGLHRHRARGPGGTSAPCARWPCRTPPPSLLGVPQRGT